MSTKISVIIPICNVEGYIKHCVETLMLQTLTDNLEYIFVNDATPDKSIEILQSVLDKYPERKDQVIIIDHESNKGLPSARNTGLSVANGDYIYHCDSDDYLEHNTLELLYKKAIEEDADIVWCDYKEIWPNGERYKKQPAFQTAEDAICGMLIGQMEYNVWNKLVKRTLYTDNGIFFPDGFSMGEDLTMISLFANARKIAYVPETLYNYVRTNVSAMTCSMSNDKMKSLVHNVYLMEYCLVEKFGTRFNLEIATLKLNLKWPYLISSSSIDAYKEWNNWFKEANYYINNQHVSRRLRFLEMCAEKQFYWPILLHYWIVLKFLFPIAKAVHNYSLVLF
ncbi:MAG: glycosyltransferase family 2 protein [Coprococcus catus]|nr:glycosyltransferase family 2 protein [Coprococcus catus]